MLQKHRQLWKGILTGLVVILYPFLLYTNFGYQMWGHPLNLFLSGVYMLLLYGALFVFGKSQVPVFPFGICAVFGGAPAGKIL